MKSQSWLPKEEHVRQLLCVDPCCQVCDAATLEIRQLLESEQSQISPALLELPQDSSCLEMLSTSSETFEQNVELHPRPSIHLSLASETSTLAQLTDHLAQPPNAAGVQQCYEENLQLEQKFHLADMPMVPETMVPSRFEDPVVLMIEKKITPNKPEVDQESQDHHHLNSSVSLLSLDPENLTHTMSLDMDVMLSSHMPFLSPQVCRLLEIHVKKWIHFQKWGLPRRVEESLRQLMPDPTSFCQFRKTPFSSCLSSGSELTMDKVGTMSHHTKSLCWADQPTQACWVSEWPVVSLKQRKHWHQIHAFLPSREAEHLSDFYPPPKAQANDSGSNFQSEYYSQLFCGLPSLHSESLDVPSLSSQGGSENKTVSKLSSRDPTRELSLPFLPQTQRQSAPPTFSSSPNAETPHEHKGAGMDVPVLTLAECEALECHLLDRQVKLRWGLPAVVLRNRDTGTHVLCEARGKTKTVKTTWPFWHCTKESSFPEHARRLLEFHLQKQLIHLRWGLPQRIQRSIHLVLSSPGQQPRGALPNVSILQPGDPEADESGDTFAVAVDRGSVPTPHLFSQAKAMLKTHVDSKCGQIHQGRVPACVQSSWECRISRSLSVGASVSNIPASRHLELQAKSNPDLQHTAVSQEPEPAALDQEKQASSGALIEHCKRPQALPEETIKKLETTLQHKYLAFLSGLPALYCVALSRPSSPAVTSKPRTTERMSGAAKCPPETLPHTTSLEGSLEPCTRDDKKASANIAGQVQSEVQVAGRTGKRPPDSPNLLNTHILARLNFHLKKKVLAMQFGISTKEREYKELAIADLESEAIQEFLRSLSIPESTALPQLPNSGDSPPAPDANRVHLGKQPATAGQAVCHKQKQPSSKAAPHGSAQWGSKASQLRNMTEAQVHCVQLETNGEKPNLEKTFSTEPQSPGKSKYSAHVPTLTEKRHESGKPKAVWDLEEGDAGLGLPLTSGKTHHDGDEEPEKRPLPETPQGSSEQRPRSYPPSPQNLSEFEFPDPPPEVLMVIDATQNMQGSLTKVDAILEPARSAKVPQPVASKTSQGLPFPCPPTQGKPFRGQAWQDHISQMQVTPASPHASPSLPEAGLKNKMKSFLHSMSPKIKDKTHMEPMVSTPGKVSKPSQENADKGLPQAKSPTKKTKTENCRVPKAQPASSEKSVITSFITAPHILDSKLGPGSRQHSSVSVSGQPRHCPRHCPRLACATQQGNPPRSQGSAQKCSPGKGEPPV